MGPYGRCFFCFVLFLEISEGFGGWSCQPLPTVCVGVFFTNNPLGVGLALFSYNGYLKQTTTTTTTSTILHGKYCQPSHTINTERAGLRGVLSRKESRINNRLSLSTVSERLDYTGRVEPRAPHIPMCSFLFRKSRQRQKNTQGRRQNVTPSKVKDAGGRGKWRGQRLGQHLGGRTLFSF